MQSRYIRAKPVLFVQVSEETLEIMSEWQITLILIEFYFITLFSLRQTDDVEE